MGLDNFWMKGDERVSDSFCPELSVCGGMFSGHGCTSFRGKVYSSIIAGLCNEISLYDDLTPEQVQEVDEILQKTSYFDAKDNSDYDLEENEWADFVKMWHIHAEAGHSLKAWF